MADFCGKTLFWVSMNATCRPAQQPIADRVPPHLFFVVSAIFHYLGPSFAVLLFARIEPLGVAWLRIASAAVVFSIWRQPWRFAVTLSLRECALVAALGAVLAAMNASFYLAIHVLPLGTVGAIEFLGPIALAAIGLSSRQNLLALALAIAGVATLTDVRFEGAPIGYLFAFANCLLFVLYVVLGHRIAGKAGIDLLSCAMMVAAVVALPLGISEALPAFASVPLLVAAIGVGITSSVIPYVTDQLAMARLPRATFALMLSVLPATAALIGFVVLRQVPTTAELAGIALVAIGVALHRQRKTAANA
jgi:inner membrane transporter RhtA